MQVLGAPWHELLHQGEAQALGDAAVDLALDLDRVDRPAHVVRRDDAADTDRAQRGVDLDLRELRGEAVGGIGDALAVGVERRRRRIEAALSDQHVVAGGRRQRGQVDPPLRAVFAQHQRAAAKGQNGARPDVGQAQDLPPQVLTRGLDGIAGYEGLAGRGGLAGVERAVGVAGDEADGVGRQAQRVGADLHHDRVRSLADVDRTTVQRHAAIAPQTDAHGRRVGQRGVADAVPHAADADPAAQGAGRAVGVLGGGAQCAPARAQCLQAGAQADARLQALAGRRHGARDKSVAPAKLQRVDPDVMRQGVHQRLVGDRRLRHAEAAEGAARRLVRVPGGGGAAHRRHRVRTHGVDRHPAGHRRAPGSVGAGVEIAVHRRRRQPPLGVAGETGANSRRVPLGRRRHALRPRVDAAHRPVQQPGGDRHQRLQRQVQLAAEAAADGRRDHPHLLLRQAEDQRQLIAVHVGRLRARHHLDAVADAPGIAGFRLDVRVFDEGRLERALGDGRGAGEGVLHVAADHPAGGQQVALGGRVKLRRVRMLRRVVARNSRQRLPDDRHVVVADRPDRGVLADQRQHRLAAVAHMVLGQHRLVLVCRVDADAVAARDVGGGEDTHHPGMRGLEGCQVAEPEAGVGVRRAHGLQRQAARGLQVGAERLRPGHLGDAVDLLQPGAHRVAGSGSVRRGGDAVGGGQHRLDDLAVAGAAAQHAAQRVQHLRFARLRPPRQQVGRGHQHAGRTDAALRRAVDVEGFLQR